MLNFCFNDCLSVVTMVFLAVPALIHLCLYLAGNVVFGFTYERLRLAIEDDIHYLRGEAWLLRNNHDNFVQVLAFNFTFGSR